MRAFLIEGGEVIQKAAPSQTAADMGQGWVDGPDGVTCGYLYDGQSFTAPTAEPTEEDVKREREVRLAAGFNYDFTDARGVHRIGTTAEDMAGWDEVSKAAMAMIETGNPTGTIDIFTNTGPTQVTASEWQLVLIAAKDFRQPIFAASFTLMAQTPIPADYAADKHWPA